MNDNEDRQVALIALVREIGRSIHQGEVDPDRQAAALDHLRAARAELLDGEPRLRWYEVDLEQREATRAVDRELSTFSGSLNPLAPPMRVRSGVLADGRPVLLGRVRLDRLREGPPHAAHGGVLAGLFDELLGGAQRLNGGPPGVTGRLTVRYRRPTPLDTDLELRAWIHDERKRRVVVRGECTLVEGASGGEATVTAEADAIFLRVDFDRLDEMMRGRAEGHPPASAPPLERN